jgi:integrase
MPERINLTDTNIADIQPGKDRRVIYDAKLPGFCVRVEPSGRKTFYFTYSIRRRVRKYKIGPVGMTTTAARVMVKKLLWEVADGRNPQAERKAQRSSGITFAQLQKQYVEEKAKKENKSWAQANSLMIAYVLKHWGDLKATEITRTHVRALVGQISAKRPILANSVKAAISAIFTFAVDQEIVDKNPCKGIAENKTSSRKRVLSETEIALFWEGCDLVNPVRAAALKTILFTGQRPGEVSHMRHEHIMDGWWTMPGDPVPELGWPGTKNGESHKVWLSAKVQELISAANNSGFVFASERGNHVRDLNAAMRKISKTKGLVPEVHPHDLRRTAGTLITGRGHGREAMDRMLNHHKKSTGDVYDHAIYDAPNKIVWEDLTTAVANAVEGEQQSNVVAGDFRKVK